MGGAAPSPTHPVISLCLPSLTAFLTFSLKASCLSFWSCNDSWATLLSSSATYASMASLEAPSMPNVLAFQWSASPGSMPYVPMHLIRILVLTARSHSHLGGPHHPTDGEQAVAEYPEGSPARHVRCPIWAPAEGLLE